MIRVASLYRFTRFDDPAALRAPLLAACEAADVRGTLLLAYEGINGTIAGPADAVETVLRAIAAVPGCADLDVRIDHVATMPFHRMKVRLKKEIVSLGAQGLDPARDTGTYVAPEDWNALIADPDTLVIDTRNAYEVAIGSFEGAVDPRTASFRDFPAWFRAHRDTLLAGASPPKVAMFCTGGIRCEKATAFLKAEGVPEVFHLKGGILHYLETVDAGDSLWRGECFVFDQRVAVGHKLAAGTHVVCHACRRPVGAPDRESALFRPGVQCPACARERDDAQRAGYTERQRQVAIADGRGSVHLGVRSDKAD